MSAVLSFPDTSLPSTDHETRWCADTASNVSMHY